MTTHAQNLEQDAQPLPLSPEQELTLRIFPDIQRQAFGCLLRLDVPGDVRHALLGVLQELVLRHDAFRVFFTRADGGWQQWLASGSPLVILERATSSDGLVARPDLRLDRAPMMRAVHVTEADGDYLYLALHHMVFDGLSLHVLLEELDALLAGRRLRRTAPSFAAWLRHLSEMGDFEDVATARRRWESQLAPGAPEAPVGRREGPNRLELTRSETVDLDLATARAAVRVDHPTARPDVLALTVLLQALGGTLGCDRFHLCLTHNGRTEDRSTLSMTAGLVGLAVTHYYVVLDVPPVGIAVSEAYQQVAGQLDGLPSPSSFGNAYQRTEPESRGVLRRLSDPFATYTYHSSKTGSRYRGTALTEVDLPPGPPRTGERTPDFSLIVEAGDPQQVSRATVVYSPHQYERDQIRAWLDMGREISRHPGGRESVVGGGS